MSHGRVDQYGHAHPTPSVPQSDSASAAGSAGPALGHVQVQPMALEPQPWVRSIYRWFARNTVGVARIDFRRPVPPQPEQYAPGNLLFASTGAPYALVRPPQPHSSSPQSQTYSPYPSAPPSAHPGRAYPPHAPAPRGAVVSTDYASAPPLVHRPAPSGARIKVMRSLIWPGLEPGEKMGTPLLDLGVGVSCEFDRQRIEPVLRLKLAGLVSVKPFPIPHVRLCKTLPVLNTGMAVKVLYEAPLSDLQHFYRPPARFMVRLEHHPGSGLKLSPTGIDLDQTALTLGSNLSLRGTFSFIFPRSIPIDLDADNFGLKVQRLSVKALW